MSNVNKRVMKQNQRPRKKPLAHHPKMPTTPGLASGDTGLVSAPLATYHLIRNFMGNIAEVHTSTHVSIGVIKAISPSGGMGLLSVRTTPIGSEDGPFTVEKDRFIPFSEIRKVVARNVNPAEVNKDDVQVDESYQLDDPDGGLQRFYGSGEDADACSLNSDDHFSPEQMFEVNKQKYNVKSTYNENLEGYTVPLNKSDPEFKIKEEYYAKVAKEIEEDKSLASAWETTAENEIENEEIKFSAVLKEGLQGRELKNAFSRNNRRGGRGNNRASLPHPPCEASDVNKPESKSVKSNSSALSREQSKSNVEPVAGKPLSNVVDKGMSKTSQGTAPVAAIPVEKSVSNEQSDGKFVTKLDFDPDAPVFEPSQSLSNESSGASPITTSVFTQPPTIVSSSVISQQSIPNGGSQAIAFSSLPCVGPGIPPQFVPFRPPQVGFTPQQFAMITQQYSALSAAANQASIQSSRGPRPNTPGGYSKQRSLDQANAVSMPVFPAIGYSGSYSLGVPFISSVAGNITLAHPIHAASGSVSASPSVQQSSASAHSNQPTAGQVNHMNSGSQTVSSPSPAQGVQYHPGFNPQLGVQNPTGVSAYPQYPAGQFVGSQTVGSLGYYPQAIYQTPGGIIYPMQQVAGGNQSQLGPQAHSHNQQPLIPQPLQLQPPQQQGSIPQQQLLYASYQFSPQAAAAAHAVSVNMSQQNAFVHPHVQLYMTQQPNSTG